MRVLLLADFFPPVLGGVETHVRALARSLVERGDKVTVANLIADGPREGYDVRRIPSIGRFLPHVDAKRPFPPPLPDPIARRALSQLLADTRPDVVHAHSLLAASLPARRSPPLVLTVHDYGMVCQLRTLLHPTGGTCSGPALVKCVRCASTVRSVATAVPMALGTRVNSTILRPDAVLAVSRALADRYGPLWSPAMTVLPNFVSGRVDGAEPGLPLPPRYVLFAGDPGEHKGLQLLLELWAAPGGMPVPLVVALSRAAVGLQVPPGVVMTQLDPAQLAGVFRRADVCVVPSIWPDPAPTVVLEALREATPVVAAAVGGIPEMVQHEQNGLLHDPGDLPQLRRSLCRVLTDDDLRGRLGVGARRSFARFADTTVVPRIVGVYERVIAARTRQRDARAVARVAGHSAGNG